MVHPFCCVTAHFGVNIVVVVQTVAAIFFIGYGSFNIYSAIQYENDYELYKTAKSTGIGMGVTWIVYSFIHLGLVILLFKAMKQKSISKSRIWLISTSILLLVHLLLFLIVMFCLPETVGWINPIYIHIPFMLIIAYLLWAVGIYIYEIELEGKEPETDGPVQYS